jgi:hypothetical protein
MGNTLTKGYYSPFKRILTYATAWMNLEDIMLIKMTPSQKDKYYMISLA